MLIDASVFDTAASIIAAAASAIAATASAIAATASAIDASAIEPTILLLLGSREILGSSE